MSKGDKLFLSGVAQLQAGRLEQAETFYRKALKANRKHANALHHLGLIDLQRGRLQSAEKMIREALALSPAYFEAWGNLATVLMATNRNAEAEAALRESLKLRPEQADTHANLGKLLAAEGRTQAAETAYRFAIRLNGKHVLAHFRLSVLLAATGRQQEAEAVLRQLLDIKPSYAPAHYNLGVLLAASHRIAEAEATYRAFIALNPCYAPVHNNLGVLLKNTGRLVEAQASLRRAVEIDPAYVAPLVNMGNLLEDAGHLADAQTHYRRALSLDPGHTPAYRNLALLLANLGRLGESEACWLRALSLDAADAETRTGLGMLRLAAGRLAEGWPDYESRFGAGVQIPPLPSPRWRGESLAGLHLVLVGEQGFGDVLQFIRYASLLKAQGVRRLSVVCAPNLVPLIVSGDGVDDASTTAPDGHDLHCPLLSLPLLMHTTLQTIPAPLPYVRALPERIAHWSPRLPAGRRIGVLWRGRSSHRNDRYRSISLPELAPLWSVPGVHFISLQKGNGQDEALQAPASQPLTALGHEMRDFADLAAIVAQMDLVISVDAAVAHMAGALNKPCWVMLPAIGTDWRWMRDREDSPWYPGCMRLYRQQQGGEWGGVVDRLASDLKSLAW